MKLNRFFPAQLFAALLVCAAMTVRAETVRAETVRYEARPGSRVKIEGTSTVHDWTVTSAIIGGFMEFESDEPLDPAKATGNIKVAAKVQVTIPVRSIKSDKSLMDEVMHDAMKVKDFDKIAYTLTEIKLKNPDRKPGDPLEFNTKGELTVAGVKKPVDMVVTMRPVGERLHVTGSTDLKMTDFGIKPPAPSVGLGLIKTADEVKITFEWITNKKAVKTASAQ